MRRMDVGAAIAMAAVSLAVTVPRAFAYPFWQDEVESARVIVSHGPISLLRTTAADDTMPPGYFFLGWMLHRLGAPVVWERALSVAAAAVLAGAVVLYARRMLPLVSASLAGLVVAIAWQFERHGWELRTYSVLAIFGFAFVAQLEALVREPSRARQVVLAAIVACGALVHYFFVFTIAAGVSWLFVSPAAITRRKTALVPIVVGLVPLALWFPGFLKQYQHQRFATLGAFSLRRLVDLYADLLERSLPGGAAGLLLALAVLALVIAGAVRLWRDPVRGRLCALAALVPLVVTAVLWAAGPHIFVPRNLIATVPFAGIAMATALRIRWRTVALAATAAAAGLLSFGFVRASGRITPHYDEVAAQLVAAGWSERDPIVLFGPVYDYLHPLDWYLPGERRLEISTPSPRPCNRLFVVSIGGRGRFLLRHVGGSVRYVQKVAVARVPWSRDIWVAARRRDGNVLATTASPCTRPRGA